jgi:ubiquinone/menaquinone biosynthesis C-methylase UbiE
MVEAVRWSPGQLRRLYDRRSSSYRRTTERLEAKPRGLAVEAAAVQPGERVLEVAVGPGASLIELARHAGPDVTVTGLDLSEGMLRQARLRAEEEGLANVELVAGDARSLPFADESFDVLFNSYMLDLVPLADMAVVLGEFRRVLRPGGRLVLLNMSKRDPGSTTWFERLYRALPDRWAPYLVGACRPVVMAEGVRAARFEDITRRFIANGLLPAELITAKRPD